MGLSAINHRQRNLGRWTHDGSSNLQTRTWRVNYFGHCDARLDGRRHFMSQNIAGKTSMLMEVVECKYVSSWRRFDCFCPASALSAFYWQRAAFSAVLPRSHRIDFSVDGRKVHRARAACSVSSWEGYFSSPVLRVTNALGRSSI